MTNNLTEAKARAAGFVQARESVEAFLTPFIDQYTNFLTEMGQNNYYNHLDATADTFVEIDGNSFYFTGDEEYSHGDYYTPNISLPFDFVEDPEAYMAKARAADKLRKAKAEKDKEAVALHRLERARKELAAAEAAITKANEDGDLIKIVATQNQISGLKGTLSA